MQDGVFIRDEVRADVLNATDVDEPILVRERGCQVGGIAREDEDVTEEEDGPAEARLDPASSGSVQAKVETGQEAAMRNPEVAGSRAADARHARGDREHYVEVEALAAEQLDPRGAPIEHDL